MSSPRSKKVGSFKKLGCTVFIHFLKNEEAFYRIDVALPVKLITSYNKEIEFKQEMRGVAELIIENLILLDRFFYQLRNIFKRI